MTISIRGSSDRERPAAYEPTTVVSFRIGIVTNVRGNETFLDVDFGDQSGLKTYSLAPNRVAAGVDASNYALDHVYLVESYAEDCTLVIAFDHMFENSVRNFATGFLTVSIPCTVLADDENRQMPRQPQRHVAVSSAECVAPN